RIVVRIEWRRLQRATMKILLSAAMLTAAIASATAPAAERPQDRWNLADLYPSTDAWNADAAKLDAELPQIAACRGHLNESARRLRECFELRTDATKRYFRLAVYSGQLLAEDTGNAQSLALQQRTSVLGSKFGEATSFINPEVLV